ncbi:sti1, partial [Mucuna pruriens]
MQQNCSTYENGPSCGKAHTQRYKRRKKRGKESTEQKRNKKMETLKAAIPEGLKRAIGDNSVDDLRSTCSSLHRFFLHFDPFHQMITELADPKYALCGKNKDAALKSKNLGNQCFSNADYAKALDCYTQALRKAPLDTGGIESNLVATLYINRATVLHKMSLLVECLRDCTRALQICPSYAKAWYRRGKANASLGNYKNAICDLNVAKSVEPSMGGKRQIEGELKILLDQCKSMSAVVQIQHKENNCNTVGHSLRSASLLNDIDFLVYHPPPSHHFLPLQDTCVLPNIKCPA